jgi:hypothetical protein
MWLGVGLSVLRRLGAGGAVRPAITDFAITGAAPNPVFFGILNQPGSLYYFWNTAAALIGTPAIEAGAIAATPDQIIACIEGANTGTPTGTPTAVGDHYVHVFLKNAAGVSSIEYVGGPYVVAAPSNAWDLDHASYASKSFSVAANDTNPQDIYVKADGLQFWVPGDNGNKIMAYSMSVAWDMSTAAFVKQLVISAQDTAPTAVFFKPDGTKMYVLGNTNNDVFEYALSGAWDIATATFSTSFSLDVEDGTPQGLYFSDDGTSMYMAGASGDDITQYTLSTAWLVSTATYTRSFSVAAQTTAPLGLAFGNSGAVMYVIDQIASGIIAYTLSTPWNISTAAYSKTKSLAAQDTVPAGCFWKADGLKFFMVGETNNTVYQYEVA